MFSPPVFYSTYRDCTDGSYYCVVKLNAKEPNLFYCTGSDQEYPFLILIYMFFRFSPWVTLLACVESQFIILKRFLSTNVTITVLILTNLSLKIHVRHPVLCHKRENESR